MWENDSLLTSKILIDKHISERSLELVGAEKSRHDMRIFCTDFFSSLLCTFR